ncbi:MAG: hypothetical protein WCU74_00040 [Candidatus Omnitrophota bacterium]
MGEILIEDGILTPENVDEALLHQKKEGGVIGQILIRLGYVTEDHLIAALCKQLTVPYLPLAHYTVNGEAVRKFRYDFCKQNMIIVFDQDDQFAYLATSDPLNDTAIDQIEKQAGCPVQVFLSAPTEIMNMLDLAFASDPNNAKSP